MKVTTMEQQPQPQPTEITTPNIYYNTHERRLGLNWLNTTLKAYGELEPRVEYEDADTHLCFTAPDGLWQDLMDSHFPLEYYYSRKVENYWRDPDKYPTPYYSEHYYEPVKYTDPGGNEMSLMWHNTRVRCYGESEYDHVEIRHDGQLRGIRGFPDWLLRHLFENDYPVVYLPTVELDVSTKQWYERLEQ